MPRPPRIKEIRRSRVIHAVTGHGTPFRPTGQMLPASVAGAYAKALRPTYSAFYLPSLYTPFWLRTWASTAAPMTMATAHPSMHSEEPSADSSVSILHELQQILAHPEDPNALARIQETLATAYTTTLSSFHEGHTPTDLSSSQATALDILGTAAEALVAVATSDALVLARKLLTYAHLHVGPIPMAYFRRMAARLGERGDAMSVLQWERLAHTHHPEVQDAALHYSRLLACIALGRDMDVHACWTDMRAAGGIPLKAYEACVAYWSRQGDVNAVRTLLRQLVASGYDIPTSIWLNIWSVYPPLARIIEQERSGLEQLAPNDMLPALILAMLAQGAARYVTVVLQAAQVPGSERLPIKSTETVLTAWMGAWTILPPVPVEPTTLALAATWCGRRGLVDAALAFLHATCTSEADEVTRTHAVCGAIQALVRAARPNEGLALAQHVTGLDWGVAPSTNLGMEALPRHYVPLTGLLTATLLDCANALYSVGLARRVLEQAFMHNIRFNGYLCRALARMIMHSIEPHREEMSQLCRALARPIRWAGAPIARRSSMTRWLKLKKALVQLGFEDRVRVACLQSERRKRVSGRRSRTAGPSGRVETVLHGWVRDTALLPSQGSDTVRSRAPVRRYIVRTKGLRRRKNNHLTTLAAFAERLRLHAALRISNQARKVFRIMLKNGLTPHNLHVELMLRALCARYRKRGIREASWLVREALPAWHITPTVPMYTVLVRAFARTGNWRAATRELQDMQKHGLTPDTNLLDTVSARAAAVVHKRGMNMKLLSTTHDSIDVTNLGSVAQHFQLLMRQHAYLEAQKFYAQCLEQGMIPDYALRRRLKRSGHWLRTRVHDNKAERQAALALHAANTQASSHIQQTEMRARIQQRRQFRHELITLTHDLLSGRMEYHVRQVR